MDIATGAMSSIISKLADLLKAEYNLQSGVKDQIESLTKELKSAQAFLKEIDKVPPEQLDEQVKLYVCEVREASYDMEDILDTFLIRIKGPEPIKKKRKKKLIKRLQEKMASFFSKTAVRHGIARAINDIMNCLQEATERRGRYTVDSSIVTRPSPSSTVDPRLSAMYKHVTELVGVDKSRDELASLLSLSSQVNETSDEKLKIVSVVGVGGLGKTTLAKIVYNDFRAQFSCCAFVPVGRNPDMKKVLRDILIEFDKDKYIDPKFTILDERQLVDELRDFLEKMRYIIVIDDVWDIKSRETINLAFVENNNGSRVIITTRNSEVAIGECYKLLPLSDDNSKKLLYSRLFGSEDSCQDNQRQKVSKVADKILKKCGGVPLAIITMASLLVGKALQEWFDVCDSIRFHDKGKEKTGDTMWILSLSYYDLPSHLKTCLLYLSVFPEDHVIRKDQLIWMWIAEGFVVGKQGTWLFEIGEGYYNELINRSLIQPANGEYFGMFQEGCRVHDMILDLICSLSCEANFATILDNDEETLSGIKARRLALQNRMVNDAPQNNHYHTDNTMRARSFISFGCRFITKLQLQSFNLLRVLHIEGSNNVYYDEHIGDLHHLRYLGMQNPYSLKHLIEIRALKFLQVLYLDLEVQDVLPLRVGMLTQLVCLHAPRLTLRGEIIKDLTSLQELTIGTSRNNDKSRGQLVKYLGNLIELRVLNIRSTKIMDRRTQLDLFTSIGNLHKLKHLDLRDIIPVDEAALNGGLPSCISPSHLPNISRLSLTLLSLDNQGLKILGALPELCCLYLHTFGHATLTGTASRGYFQKLRSCVLCWSMVNIVVNEEDTSVSFTIWHENDDAPAFGSKRKQDSGRVTRAIMPNLEALYFRVDVEELTTCNSGSCDNLGLEYLASLQKVTVRFHSRPAPSDVVKKEKAALRHAIQVHPNRPTLQIT